jgi:hypothetical protein
MICDGYVTAIAGMFAIILLVQVIMVQILQNSSPSSPTRWTQSKSLEPPNESEQSSATLSELPTRAVELYGKKPGIDPDFDLIVDPQLANNEYPASTLEAQRAAEHTSLAARFATPEVWDNYRDKVSSGPSKWTLARAINTGVLYPESFVGCHAGDMESYTDFKDFFYPVIEAYHEGFKIDQASAHSLFNGMTAMERMDAEKITAVLSASAQEKVVSTRIRVARNLAMFPLNPGGSKESREEIATMMAKVYASIATDDLKGNFYLHTKMSDGQRQALNDGQQMYRGKDRMQSASGYH